MNAPDSRLVAADQEPAPMVTVAGQLAHYAAGFSFNSIPQGTRERAKYLMLDAIGIAYASTQYDFAHRIHNGIASLAKGGSNSLIGFPGTMPLRDAILFNAALVHGLDYDDTHVRAIIHATASAFPCALSVSESVHTSGSALLAAYVLGVEIAVRVSDAAGGKFHDRGFHPTGVAAHFSCALQAGWLYGLTAQQLVMAQGLMGSTAAGSQEFLEEGAWNKRMHPGWAGVAGVTAAHLARAGYKGPSKVYEGRFGLYPNYLGEHAQSVRYEAIAATLGKVWEVHGVAIKPYPICHLIHACADAMLLLREQHALRAADIERIVALVPEKSLHLIAEPHATKIHPANEYDAKFSTQYVLATCLIKGRFGLAELSDDILRDPEILQLAAQVECVADPDSRYPDFFSGGVEIHLCDGRTLRHHEPVNRGAGDRALTEAEIEQKYFDNALLALSRSKAEAVRDAALDVERYSAVEFAQLLSAS